MTSVVLAGMAIGLVAGGASAQSNAENQDSPFGIGFQSSWPSYGISGLYDMSDQITVQAVIGALGTVTNFGGRLMYRFQTAPVYDLYGFGSVGYLGYDYGFGSEGVVGFGGGAGIELDWASIFESAEGGFPPLYTSIELGFMLANFEHYNWSGFSMGGSLHYRF